MPVKPYIPPIDRKATSVGLMNYIRNIGDADFQAGVPLAIQTTECIKAIGNSIIGYQPRQNHFVPALFGVIGKVIIASKSYTNKLAWARQGELQLGETIEEIWNGLSHVQQYNPERAQYTVFKRHKPEAEVAFHSLNYQKNYPATIERRELELAFQSWDNFEQFVTKIIARVYDTQQYDEFIMYKYIIQTLVLQKKLYVEGIPVLTEQTANVITARIRGISNAMEFMSNRYNMAGVPTTSNKDEQYVIMTADYSARLDTESLAHAFNLEYVQFWGKNMMVDSFAPNALEMERLAEIMAEDPSYIPFTSDEIALLETIKVVIMDSRWYMIFTKLREMQSIFNPESLGYNYFYHVWDILSASPFQNCLVFAEGENKVSAITINPQSPSVVKGKGGTELFSQVQGEGLYSEGVSWTISGNTSKNTYVSRGGLVVAGADEEATNLTVTATSRADNKISATVSVTVTDAPNARKPACNTGQVKK